MPSRPGCLQHAKATSVPDVATELDTRRRSVCVCVCVCAHVCLFPLESRNLLSVFILLYGYGTPEGKRPLGRPRRRWEDNVKMDIQKWDVGVWTGSRWLRIGTGGGHL